MNRQHQHAAGRFNNFHGPKRQACGQPHAGPAGVELASGSKILLSRLPTDVGEKEVEELFRKTVGPVKECFLIYNSQGNSKGMAVVAFARATDAASAKTKYHGKIVDGRKPLKIEIVLDEIPPAAPSSGPLSLLQRLSGPTAAQPAPPVVPASQKVPPKGPAKKLPPSTAPLAPRVAPAAPVRPRKVKKGPKRLQKKPVTAADLDQEMDEYQKQALQEIEMGNDI
ncbi:hypothetical protein FA13DRAFT_1753875 [Coprinellus micaceus]|uniref:RRM domain-containing protein n=1 Tax=Coprinellus micaceus TaxID=71717 RepID=A0A4Y7TJN2_COPMI|nr:hypothetical protein FA13DRAFT_1753875 [Coprinellus micaceus]